MGLLLEGIKAGLVLCFLIGPIFFALVQTGVEEGARAGAMVGLGIWVSDFIFIQLAYWGVTYIRSVVQGDSFPVIFGAAGSVILIAFGLFALLRNPPFQYFTRPETKRTTPYIGLWFKGFLINTVNPFTVFFWMGLMSTIALEDQLTAADATYFFGGILGTIIITDTTKVLLAKRIRQALRPIHLLWFRRISGAALILFGLVLLGRVIWMTQF